LSRVDKDYLRRDGLNKALGDLDLNVNKIKNAKDPTDNQDLATKSYVDRGLSLARKYKVLIVAGQSNTYFGREWCMSEAITTVKYMHRRILQFGIDNGQADTLMPCSLRLEVNESDNMGTAGYGAVLAGMIMQDAIGLNTLNVIQPDEMLLILPCMLGAQGFSNGYFTPNGVGFKNLIRRIRYILNHYSAEFIGMTWSQGETDALAGAGFSSNYQYILQYFIQAVRDYIAYSSSPFDPLPTAQAKADKIPFVTFQMSPTWVADNSALATPVQTALSNVGNVIPYTSSITLTGLPATVRTANIDTIHYDSRQQLFLAQQFYTSLSTAKANTNANGNYTPTYTSGSTLLARHTVSPTDLFPAFYYGAFSVPSASPTTAAVYSQLYKNWQFKNSNGYYKYRLSYKIGGVWKNIIFEQVYLPLMTTHYQNVAQLISTDTIFGSSNANGQGGFSGIVMCLVTQAAGSILTLDTGGGQYWATVCQTINFPVEGVSVIPVCDNYYLNNMSSYVTATDMELYAIRD
jgi:Carbohydrate esterase, sialic acid-specific acetylesterase